MKKLSVKRPVRRSHQSFIGELPDKNREVGAGALLSFDIIPIVPAACACYAESGPGEEIILVGTPKKMTTERMKKMEKNELRNSEEGNAVAKLMAEVEAYRQAIQDAKAALESAEQELDEVLQAEYEKEQDGTESL